MPPGETSRKKGPMGPWISPTSSLLHIGWPWRYIEHWKSMDWEGKIEYA